ncbi:MAG: hypothetical protein H7321_03120 [Bacteroidia bacterium]|nr:hypothetical protein [Bacteroidia bacterium]
MKRKEFLKKSFTLTAGGIVMPYILPTGRLYARTNAPLADHVVYVLFAGGVRQQDSILQQYLEGSQGLSGIGGNIMYNLFEGAPPTSKIAYGTSPSGQPNGSSPIPKILSQSLQKQGTVFREMRSVNGGHYGGLNSLITGSASTGQGLKVRPSMPTIFEYARRHGGYKATDVWFIGNGIGNSTPLLNSSLHPDYGLNYGANFFAPNITFGSEGYDVLANAKIYHPQEELEPIYKMKNFLDNTYRVRQGQMVGIKNTDDEKTRIKEFIRATFQKKAAGQLSFPPVSGGDGATIGYAIEVLKEFKPKVLVVNMSEVDVGHGSFTGSLQALHRADHAVGYLWQYIQSQIPEMSGKTIMLCAPECGRNLNPNPIKDENDWFGYDHGDSNTNRVWGMMAGPNVPSNLEVGSESSPVGYVNDFSLTIAEILGIKFDVQTNGYVDSYARSLFERI